MAKAFKLRQKLKIWLNPLTTRKVYQVELNPHKKASEANLGPMFYHSSPHFSTAKQRMEAAFSSAFRFVAGQINHPWQDISKPLEDSNHQKNHWGLYDYITFGIPRALESLTRAHWAKKSPLARKIIRGIGAVLWVPLMLVRGIVSAAIFLPAMPFVAISHVVSERKRTKEVLPAEVSPNREAKEHESFTVPKTEDNHADWSQLPKISPNYYYEITKTGLKGQTTLKAVVKKRTELNTDPDCFKNKKYYKVVVHTQGLLPELHLKARNGTGLEGELGMALRNFGYDNDTRPKRGKENIPCRIRFRPSEDDLPVQVDSKKKYAYFGRYL